MRVAIVTRRLWHAGAPRIAIEQARGLAALGIEVTLIFLIGPSDDVPYRELLGGLNWIVLQREGRPSPLSALSYLLTRIASPLPSRAARVDIGSLLLGFRFIRSLEPDIALYHDPYTGLIGYADWILSRRPYGVYVHEATGVDIAYASRYQRWVRSLVEFGVLSNATSIVTNSRGTMESVHKLLQSPVRCYVLYPGGLRSGVPSASRVERDPRQVLAVSTWEEGRLPALYLEIARQMQTGRLVMAGFWKNSGAMERYQTLCASAELKDRIEITGPVSEDELVRLYDSSSVFLRLGFREKGVGLGIIEALSRGVPVVMNNEVGAKEIVTNDCSIILRTTDASVAAAVIDSLLSDPVRRASMSTAARRVSDQFGWPSHSRQLVDILARHIHGRP